MQNVVLKWLEILLVCLGMGIVCAGDNVAGWRDRANSVIPYGVREVRFSAPSRAFCTMNLSSLEEEWKAQWITWDGTAQRDQVVLHFRKIMDVGAAAPTHFWVEVSADNQFVFYVNGTRVGTGPSKSDLGHWRFETYDIAPQLKPGKNLLAATVWNFGTHAAVSQMSDRVGLLLHGKNEAERAADTDESWEVEEEKGITTMGNGVSGFYFAAGPGERVEAGKFDWNWNRADTAGGNWRKAVTLGRGALRGERDAPNNWQLVEDPLPAMEMKELPNGRVVRITGIEGSREEELNPANLAAKTILSVFTVPAHSKASILVDQGELMTGYPALTLSDGAEGKVRVTYAEALYDANREKGNRNEIVGKQILGMYDEYFPSGGTLQEFMPLGWRTWRYFQIDVETADHPLRFRGLRTWFTAYPFEERGYFRSDDDSLKKIWEIGWRTARLDAHDTYMDTPYWERLQYIGDTRIQAMISYTVAGDDRLARQAINAFNYSRIPDGLTQSRYPSALVQMIPTFSLMWVGMVHDFWMYRGAEPFVREQMEGVRSVLDWYVARQRPDGLLAKIPWWPFVDWGKDFENGESPQDADGGSSVMTMQFLEALRDAAEMEELFGDKGAATRYRAAAERASAGVWKLCWNAKNGLLADTPEQKHFSQHANILGVWLDVVPQEQQKEVLRRILDGVPGVSMTQATYYFRYYLARAVEHAGMGGEYLKLLGPWRDMVGLGLTTWAEQPEPTRSDSHAWSAHPNFDLLTIVAGIHPDTPGFGKVRIAPELGTLKKVEAGMPTVRGMVTLSLARAEHGLEGNVVLPQGMTGVLEWEGKRMELQGGEQRVGLRK